MATVSQAEPVNEYIRNCIEDMIHDLGQKGFQQVHAPLYGKIEIDSNKTLYSGCTSFTRLSVVLALVNLKARFGWSDKSFTELLMLLKKIPPQDNMLSKNHYEAKNILCPVGMEYQKIHACSNDCILYRNEFAKMHCCPTCGVSWYRVNDRECSIDAIANNRHPAKVCWYLPIKPRFKRLFANGDDAKNLTWHAKSRKSDGFLRYSADSLQWKAINCLYPDLWDEPRNLRLDLALDGLNPFGNLSTNHSSWPILLFIYNLPPWLCTKRKFIMLSMMIAGPRQPGNDIDV